MLIPVDTLLQPCHLKVSPDAPLRSVLPLMQQSPWPILPIVVGERLVGSLTVIDLVRAIDRADDGYWHQHHAVDNPGDRHRGDRREDQAPRTQTDPQITVVTCLSQVVIPIPTTGQIDLFDMGQRMHLSASSYLLAQDDRGQLLGLISLDRVWSQLGRLDWVMELLTETTLADLRPLPSLTVTPRTPLRQVARLMIGHPGQGALGVRSDPSVGAGEARSGEPLLGIITAAHLLQTWLNDPTAVAERAMTPLPPPIPLQTPLAALWDRLQPRQSQPGQLQPGQSQPDNRNHLHRNHLHRNPSHRNHLPW